LRILSTAFLVLLLLTPSWAAPVRALLLVQWSDLHQGHEQTLDAHLDLAFGEGLALKPQALLLTGDNVDNKCPNQEFRRRTEAFLTGYGRRLVRSRIPMVFSVGNNDLPRNYQTDPEGLAQVFQDYRRHLGRAFYLDALGNGVCPSGPEPVTWISLNSLVFSPLNQYEGRGGQARRTLLFLQRQLSAQPPGRPVVIASHIPPTWDLFGRNPAWEPADMQRLEELLEAYPGPVVIVSGHFHRNEVHAFTLEGGRAVPVLDAGGLAGKYGYRPNWRSHYWTLDSRGVPRTLTWRNRYPGDRSLDRVWQVDQPFRARTWTGWVQRLAAEPAFYLRYTEDFWAHSASWRADAGKPENRQALLGEFLVRTGSGVAVGP